MKLLLAQTVCHLPTHGGASKGHRVLLQALARRGHECHVLAPQTGVQCPADFGTTLRRRGLEVERQDVLCDQVQVDGVRLHAVRNAADIGTALTALIRELSPDRVLTSTEDMGLLLLRTALDEAPGRVVFLSNTTWHLPFGPASVLPSPEGASLFRRLAAIVAISRFMQDYLRSWGDVDSTYIPHTALTAGQGTHIDPWVPRTVTFINPCPAKGLPIFLELARAFPEVPFRAVSSWGTTPDTRSQLATLDNVEVVEASDEIEEIYRTTRVLLVPSLWAEAFGLVCVEAMRYGIPVLASQVGGLPEAKLGVDYLLPVCPIEAYRPALDARFSPVPVAPPQDVTPWCAALSRLLYDADDYQTVASASRTAAQAFVDTPGVLEALEAVLERSSPASRPG